MKKLVFPFVEIEVPDDFPDGFDLEATFKYGMEHPEVAKRVNREYNKAYRKWMKNRHVSENDLHFRNREEPVLSETKEWKIGRMDGRACPDLSGSSSPLLPSFHLCRACP